MSKYKKKYVKALMDLVDDHDKLLEVGRKYRYKIIHGKRTPEYSLYARRKRAVRRRVLRDIEKYDIKYVEGTDVFILYELIAHRKNIKKYLTRVLWNDRCSLGSLSNAQHKAYIELYNMPDELYRKWAHYE